MRIQIEGETELELDRFDQPGMDVHAHGGGHFAAIEMFVASLGLCVWSVLDSYGEQIGMSAAGASVRLRWSYADAPFRIGRIDLTVRWPGLPASRLAAVRRAATLCTLHHTLTHPPELVTEVTPPE